VIYILYRLIQFLQLHYLSLQDYNSLASTAGFSLSSLLKHLQGYTGPTILLIQTTTGNIFGTSQTISMMSVLM
jgi:hypothetical protein